MWLFMLYKGYSLICYHNFAVFVEGTYGTFESFFANSKVLLNFFGC